MEARLVRVAFIVLGALASLGASHRTPNFVVNAPTDRFAREVGDAAEAFRRDLAIHWLGKELPRWSQPCPITLQVGDHIGAGGATSFVFDRGEVYGWRMTIQGSEERILDSVLPHEVTHTIFASYFRQPLPRWADEGACTTVEHPSERAKQKRMLVEFLQTGRGIPFSQMFQMKEYPRDVMPLYSQGYSLARYLIEQGGPRKYVRYLSDGLKNDDWAGATERHYGFSNLALLQGSWLDWVRHGSPALDVATIAQNDAPAENTLASAAGAPVDDDDDVVVRAQNQGRLADFFGKLIPGRSATASTARPSVYDPLAAQAQVPPAAYQRGRSHQALDEAPPWPSPQAAPAHTAPPRPAAAPTVGLTRHEQPPHGTPAAGANASPPGRPRQVLIEWTRPQRDEPQGVTSYAPSRPSEMQAERDAPLYFDAPPVGRERILR